MDINPQVERKVVELVERYRAMKESGASAAQVAARAIEDEQMPIHTILVIMRLFGLRLAEAKRVAVTECERLRPRE